MRGPVIDQLKSLGYSGGRLVFLANQYADAWFGFMNPGNGATAQSMNYTTPRSMFPGNLTGLELSDVYLALTLADGVKFTGSFPVKLTIPGVTDQQTLTFQNGALQASLPLATANPDFMTGNWTLTVNAADIPAELKDETTGLLNPDAVLNIGQVMVFDATVDWS